MIARKNSFLYKPIRLLHRPALQPPVLHYDPASHLYFDEHFQFVKEPIFNAFDNYMAGTGRSLGGPDNGVFREFRTRILLEELMGRGETWESILASINENAGVENSILGLAIRKRYSIVWIVRAFIRGSMTNGSSTASSPLDQFSIHPILDLNMGNYYFSFTNPALSMMLTLVLVLVLLYVVTKKGGGKSVPNAWQSLVELIYDFVPNLVNEQIGGISGKHIKPIGMKACRLVSCVRGSFTSMKQYKLPVGVICLGSR